MCYALRTFPQLSCTHLLYIYAFHNSFLLVDGQNRIRNSTEKRFALTVITLSSIQMERKKLPCSCSKLKVSACPEVSFSIPEALICVNLLQCKFIAMNIVEFVLLDWTAHVSKWAHCAGLLMLANEYVVHDCTCWQMSSLCWTACVGKLAEMCKRSFLCSLCWTRQWSCSDTIPLLLYVWQF